MQPAANATRSYLARRYTEPVEAAIRNRYETTLNTADTVLSPEELSVKAKGCNYLFVSVTEQVTAVAIAALAPELKLIATLSVGTDHIDLAAARRHGVGILYTPNVLSEACAEVAILHILNATRHGQEAGRYLRSGVWPGWGPRQFLGLGLSSRRLGIFGMGRIGRCVAKRAVPFGMTVHYHNRRRLDPALEDGAIYHESADSLLAHSDVFCICAPGQEDLAGFLDADRIGRLPDNAVVVNISRGNLVDDGALIAALQSGKVFAAGLDVFDSEPKVDPRYFTLPNVSLTPHIGSATFETRNAMGFLLLEGVQALEQGHRPENYLS